MNGFVLSLKSPASLADAMSCRSFWKFLDDYIFEATGMDFFDCNVNEIANCRTNVSKRCWNPKSLVGIIRWLLRILGAVPTYTHGRQGQVETPDT